MPALLREMAFMRVFAGTISEMIDCRLGILKAARVPLQNPITRRCQKQIIPVMSSVARRKVRIAFPLWVTMIICLREIRSAKTPPSTDTKVRGRAKDIITSERAKGESLVRRRTSHPRVICCMPTAIKENRVPNHSHR